MSGQKRPAQDSGALGPVQKRARQGPSEAQLIQRQEREAEQVALQLLRTYVSKLLDPVNGQGVQVVTEWTRYPPYPQYDPSETFEWLVDRVLFSPLELEMSYDGLQLWAGAPTLRIPMQVAQATDTHRGLLALILEQNRRLFRTVERTGIGDQVTLRHFRFDTLLPSEAPGGSGLEECVPREKLLLDVLHRWLMAAHESAAKGGAGYSCILLQMRLALDRLATRKRLQAEKVLKRGLHEAKGVAELRARQLPKLYMLMNLLRLPGLYDISLRSYARFQRSESQRLLQQEQASRYLLQPPPAPSPSSSSLALAVPRPLGLSRTAPPPPRPSAPGVDPLRRLRDLTRVLKTVGPGPRPP